MPGWQPFFGAEAGASAALAGLVFVGVSINLSRIMAYPVLPGRALEALAVLVGVLIVSSLMLVPGQPVAAVGAEVLVVGLAAWVTLVTLQVRALPNLERKYRGYHAARMVLGQAATLPYLAAGAAVLAGLNGGLYWSVPGIIFSLLVASFNAWVLLVEINR